jgi:glycogen operon protein
LLATLFASRGTILLTAGDAFGRSQQGNNNAYAQDSDLTWLDWVGRDTGLEDYAAALSALRRRLRVIGSAKLPLGTPDNSGLRDVIWLHPEGREKNVADWEAADGDALAMVQSDTAGDRHAVLISRGTDPVNFVLPARQGWSWPEGTVAPRSLRIVSEMSDG